MSGPSGTPLSSLLDIGDGPLKSALEQTLKVLDAVHGDGNVGRVSVAQVGGRRQQGSYKCAPPAITINRATLAPGLSLLHEIGHLLDDVGIQAGASFRSRAGDARLAAWWAAVTASDLYLHASKMSRSKVMLVPHASGTRNERVRIDQTEVQYRLDPRELFARSYAQYVIQTSGDPALKGELDRARGSEGAKLYPEQWDNVDFAPIGRALEALLGSLGWRT